MDQVDLPILTGWAWRANGQAERPYAAARCSAGLVLMHRLLMNCPVGLVVDHVNGDGLDNRRANLRICTRRQNRWNMRKWLKPTESKFKGVWFDTSIDRWVAQIGHDGDRMRLGAFEREEDAARQYDRAARLLFGAFARTNKDMGLLG